MDLLWKTITINEECKGDASMCVYEREREREREGEREREHHAL
jgi:hypothetical protein